MKLNSWIHNYLTDSEQKVLFFLVSVVFLGFFLNQADYVYAERLKEAEKSAMVSDLKSEERSVYDLNSVTYEELLNVKGIGEKKALAILEYRKHGVFQRVEDLLNIKGFGEKTLESLSSYFYVRVNNKKVFADSSGIHRESKQGNQGKLNIASASASDLESIKGIGKKKAEAIIRYREEYGIKSYEDFLKIKGIGASLLEEIKRRVIIEGNQKEVLITPTEVNARVKININKASLEELCLIDGIGEKRAKQIIDYREKAGGYTEMKQLLEIKGIGEKTLIKLEEYIYIGE